MLEINFSEFEKEMFDFYNYSLKKAPEDIIIPKKLELLLFSEKIENRNLGYKVAKTLNIDLNFITNIPSFKMLDLTLQKKIKEELIMLYFEKEITLFQ